MADLPISTNRPSAGAPGVKSGNTSPSQASEPAPGDAFASILARSVEVSDNKGANTDGKDDINEDATASIEEAGMPPAVTTPIASEKFPIEPDGRNPKQGQSIPGIIANADLDGAAQNQFIEQRNSPAGESTVLATNPSVDKAASAKTVDTAATHHVDQLDPKGALPLDKSRNESIAIERTTAELRDVPASELFFDSPSTDAATSPAFRSFFGAAQYGTAQEVNHYDIHSPVSSPEWPRETAHVLRIMVTEKISQAEIRVNPPELGPIDVVVKVEGDSTTISFTANSPETRSLLELHLPKLREALDATGLHLADASVNSGGTQRDSRGTSGSSTSSQEYLIGSDSRSRDSKSAPGAGLVTITRSDRLIDIFA